MALFYIFYKAQTQKNKYFKQIEATELVEVV